LSDMPKVSGVASASTQRRATLGPPTAMAFLSTVRRLLGHPPQDGGDHSRFHEPATDFQRSRQDGGTGDSPMAVRKDLLRVVLRKTLTSNGLPTGWIGAEALLASSRNREPGLHVRFVVRHWDERIMRHSPALQADFEQRLLSFDPLAALWLRGFSWRYDLPEAAACPALPHPGSWTAAAPTQVRQIREASLVREPDDPIIAGPVVIGGAHGSMHGAGAARRRAHENAVTVPAALEPASGATTMR